MLLPFFCLPFSVHPFIDPSVHLSLPTSFLPAYLPFFCRFGQCLCLSVCPSLLFYNDNAYMFKIASSTLTSWFTFISGTQQSFAVLSEQVLGRKIQVGMCMNLLKVRFIMRKLMNGQRHARHVTIN